MAIGSLTAGEKGKIPLTTSSEEARAYYLKGLELADNQEITNAREYFERAVAADPKFALAHLNLAFTQTSTGAFLTHLQEAKALVEGISEGERLWILSVDAGARGDTTEASASLKKLVKAYPYDERAHFLLGGNYSGQQNFAKAIAEHRKAIEIRPSFPAPYNSLGYALRNSGDTNEAEKIFREYVDLIPNSPNPYDSYAELLLAIGRHDESIESYRKALSLDTHFMASYIGIATNLNLQGKQGEARQTLREMLANARNDGERRQAHFATVVSYVDDGKLPKAVEEARIRYAIAEKNGNTIQMGQDLNLIGFLLIEAGKAEEAQTTYEKSVALRGEANIPDSAKAQVRRDRFSNGARVALGKSDFAAAKQQAGSFGELADSTGNPNQVRLYHELLGMIALAENEFDKAVEELQQANQLNPYNLYRLARAYQGKNDKEKARQLCEQIEGLNSLNNLNYGLVRHHAQRILASL